MPRRQPHHSLAGVVSWTPPRISPQRPELHALPTYLSSSLRLGCARTPTGAGTTSSIFLRVVRPPQRPHTTHTPTTVSGGATWSTAARGGNPHPLYGPAQPSQSRPACVWWPRPPAGRTSLLRPALQRQPRSAPACTVVEGHDLGQAVGRRKSNELHVPAYAGVTLSSTLPATPIGSALPSATDVPRVERAARGRRGARP